MKNNIKNSMPASNNNIENISMTEIKKICNLDLLISNNLVCHKVENHSTENRIHLIMDIFDKNLKKISRVFFK